MRHADIPNVVASVVNAAKRSQHPRFFHGAVLADGAHIIASGANARYHCAERRVLQKIPKHARRNHIVLVTARVTRSGKFANSKPCYRCTMAIRRADIPAYYVESCSNYCNYRHSQHALLRV